MFYSAYSEWLQMENKRKAVKATLPTSDTYSGPITKLETKHACNAGLKNAWTCKSKNYLRNGMDPK